MGASTEFLGSLLALTLYWLACYLSPTIFASSKVIELVLGTKKPREQIGRDTFARYKAQIRSAAIAALAILEGDVDRVYCYLHDGSFGRYHLDGRFSF